MYWSLCFSITSLGSRVFGRLTNDLIALAMVIAMEMMRMVYVFRPS